MFRSIQFKLAACFALAVIGGQLALTIYLIGLEPRDPVEAQNFFKLRVQRTAGTIAYWLDEGRSFQQSAKEATKPFQFRRNNEPPRVPERYIVDDTGRMALNTLPSDQSQLTPAERTLLQQALARTNNDPMFKSHSEFSAVIAVPIRHNRQTVGAVLARMELPTMWSILWDRIKYRWPVRLVIALGIALFFGLGLSFVLTRRLRGLTATVVAISSGDLSRRVVTGPPDEIGRLGREFNAMTEQLQQTIGAVEAQRDQLAGALQQLEHLEASRRQLIADASHELRTPLACVQGNLEALIDGVIIEPKARQDAMVGMHEETLRLARLVQDLLTLSRASIGELEIQREPIAVDELIERIAAKFRPRAEAFGVVLETNGVCEARVVGDTGRLTQVLDNFLENALQHTPEGGRIQLGAFRKNGAVALQVEDSGNGIPPEDLTSVFDRFYRSDKSRARATGGSGLGLAIAREIVEAHGGCVGIESEFGKGTCVRAELPVA